MRGKAGFHKGAERARTRQSGSNVRLRGEHEVEARLEAELEKLKRKVGMGFGRRVFSFSHLFLSASVQ